MTGYHDVARATLALLTAYMNGLDDEATTIHDTFEPGDAELCLAFSIGLASWAIQQVATSSGVPVEAILAGIGQGIETVAVGEGDVTTLEPAVRPKRLPDQCPRCHVVDSDRIRSWRDSRDVVWQVRQCAACLVLWLELPR